MTPRQGNTFLPPFLPWTILSLLKGFLSQHPLQGPLTRLKWYLMNNKEIGTLDRCVTLGPEVSGHCQEYLLLTLIVHLFENAILFFVPKIQEAQAPPWPPFATPLPCIKLAAADSFCSSGGNLTPHRDLLYYFMSKSKHCVKCFFLSTISGSSE